VAESYYAQRSRRDPAWRERQLREAKEREARRREADPGGFKAASREASARSRAKQASRGRTFHELLEATRGDPEVLRRVLADEIRRGHIEYHSSCRRFVLNGGIPEDVKEALRELRLPG
jgi:hypothetical protein